MKTYPNTKSFVLAQLSNFAEAKNKNKVVREAAVITHSAILPRIQQSGQDSSGTAMHTSSQKAFGAYSEAYGKRRQKKGRQTNHIDLTMSGDMFKQFRPMPTNSGWGVGFASDEQAEIAGFNEERFGPIFIPTLQEEAVALATINRSALRILAQTR